VSDLSALDIIAEELRYVDSSPIDLVRKLADAGYAVVKLDEETRHEIEQALIGGSYRADSRAVVRRLAARANAAVLP
jgi:lysylphosphatidylglycerol synthetase-like protein (DUF2156 family)